MRMMLWQKPTAVDSHSVNRNWLSRILELTETLEVILSHAVLFAKLLTPLCGHLFAPISWSQLTFHTPIFKANTSWTKNKVHIKVCLNESFFFWKLKRRGRRAADMLWDYWQCEQSLFDPLRISKLKTPCGDDSFPRDMGCVWPSPMSVSFDSLSLLSHPLSPPLPSPTPPSPSPSSLPCLPVNDLLSKLWLRKWERLQCVLAWSQTRNLI